MPNPIPNPIPNLNPDPDPNPIPNPNISGLGEMGGHRFVGVNYDGPVTYP